MTKHSLEPSEHNPDSSGMLAEGRRHLPPALGAPLTAPPLRAASWARRLLQLSSSEQELPGGRTGDSQHSPTAAPTPDRGPRREEQYLPPAPEAQWLMALELAGCAGAGPGRARSGGSEMAAAVPRQHFPPARSRPDRPAPSSTPKSARLLPPPSCSACPAVSLSMQTGWAWNNSSEHGERRAGQQSPLRSIFADHLSAVGEKKGRKF